MDVILNIIVAPIALTVVLIIVGEIRAALTAARDHRRMMRGLDELLGEKR